MYERIGGGEPLRKLDTVAPVRHERDVWQRPRLAFAANHQQVVRMPETCERLQQHRQILFLSEASRINEHASFRGKLQACPQIKRFAFRAEDLRIHTERLMHGMAHAKVIQERAHRAARREHDIAALIEPAYVIAERALADSADAAADDLRQV
jgi:hypothetical protein